MIHAAICCAIGVILATAGVSVTNSWQAWAVLVLAAVNGAAGHIR